MSPELEQVRAEQAEARAESRKLALERGILLSQILEAVRALKPEQFPPSLYVRAHEELVETRAVVERLRAENDELRTTLQRRSTDYELRITQAQRVRNAHADELERLKHENERLRSEADGLGIQNGQAAVRDFKVTP